MDELVLTNSMFASAIRNKSFDLELLANLPKYSSWAKMCIESMNFIRDFVKRPWRGMDEIFSLKNRWGETFHVYLTNDGILEFQMDFSVKAQALDENDLMGLLIESPNEVKTMVLDFITDFSKRSGTIDQDDDF